MQVYKIDVNGYWIADIILQDNQKVPSDCVTIQPPQVYKPKWDGQKWIVGATQAEIDELASQQALSALQPSAQELADADFEIKVLTLLMEMEVI